MKEGGLRHRLSIARVDVRYFAKHRRWVALARSMWSLFVRRHFGERCQECGRDMPVRWWSPTPLWCELVTTGGGGLLCPNCYDRMAEGAGIRLSWTPMVVGRYASGVLVPTTNWWLSDTRDWLLMGEPDPECFTRHDADNDAEFYPTQWPWERIKNEMADVIPPSSNTWGRQERPPQMPSPRTRMEG